jgi:hypothetical protein
LNSKKHEEVRKRRAKASTTRLNLYQKMVLVAGVLMLFFLAIGISPQLAPFLVAGVVGGMMVLFLIFKTRRPKREAEAKAAPQEALTVEEESVEPQPIPSMAEGKIIGDSLDSISEQKDSEGLQENIPPEPEEAVTPDQPPPVEKEEWSPVQEFSRDGVLAQIQERLTMVEEKVSRLEDRVRDLEEKAASSQEGQLKSEPQIDLQTILSHLDEKERKVGPSIKR